MWRTLSASLLLVLFLILILKSLLAFTIYMHTATKKLTSIAKLIPTLWYLGIVAFYLRSIYVIIISEDIHKNPGPNQFSDGFFNFCHWNLNSIPAHDYTRITQIEAYNAFHDLDVIALTETALKPSDTNEKINIDGYTAVRRDLPTNTTHGGVMIFHKDNLALRHREDLENHPNLLVTEITICNKKIFFTVVYRRFGQTPAEFETFISKFDELCLNIKSENPFCSVFTGDFNEIGGMATPTTILVQPSKQN